MAKFKKSIVISATAKNVFDFINASTSLVEVWPSMIEAKDVEPLPNGGTRFRWAHKMAGMRFEGSSETTECIINERAVAQTKGGIDSTLTWICKPKDGGTKLVYEADYTVPIPLLGKLAEAIIVRQNEREGNVLLANIKERLEA